MGAGANTRDRGGRDLWGLRDNTRPDRVTRNDMKRLILISGWTTGLIDRGICSDETRTNLCFQSLLGIGWTLSSVINGDLMFFQT